MVSFSSHTHCKTQDLTGSPGSRSCSLWRVIDVWCCMFLRWWNCTRSLVGSHLKLSVLMSFSPSGWSSERRLNISLLNCCIYILWLSLNGAQWFFSCRIFPVLHVLCLRSRRLEGTEEKFRNRESRPEDLQMIAELKDMVSERESLVKKLVVGDCRWGKKCAKLSRKCGRETILLFLRQQDPLTWPCKFKTSRVFYLQAWINVCEMFIDFSGQIYAFSIM